MIAMAHPATGGFQHEALFYAGVVELVERAVPFIREGLDAGEAVLVVLTADKLRRLEKALGPDSRRVQFRDMLEIGRNPATIIPAWRDFVDTNAAAGRLRGIGEPIWRGRSPEELVEAQRHEALLNVAFDGSAAGFKLLCPYDTSSLAADVVESAKRTHPHVVHGAAHSGSADYRGHDDLVSAFAGPLPAPPPEALETAFGPRSLADARNLVARVAGIAGLSAAKRADLMLAVAELAANSVRHGGGGGRARAWAADGTAVCEVEDDGRIEDPLVGRVRPPLTAASGRGLWLVNHLCDLVQVRSRGQGTVVRVSVGC